MAEPSLWGDEHALLALRKWIVCLWVPFELRHATCSEILRTPDPIPTDLLAAWCADSTSILVCVHIVAMALRHRWFPGMCSTSNCSQALKLKSCIRQRRRCQSRTSPPSASIAFPKGMTVMWRTCSSASPCATRLLVSRSLLTWTLRYFMACAFSARSSNRCPRGGSIKSR
jgi:hypothetical protein